MGTVKITVVRHGQTDWNKNKILQGWEQTVLNREGIASVCSIAEYLYGQEYDMILTSDLLRAQQTAKIFSEKLNLPIQYLEHLRERYLGELQGTYEGYIQIPNPVESDMEPTLLFVRRIISIFKRIAKGEWGSSILVITHGGPIKVLCQCCPGGMTLKYDYDTIICRMYQRGISHDFYFIKLQLQACMGSILNLILLLIFIERCGYLWMIR